MIDPRQEARDNAACFGADEIYASETLLDKYCAVHWDDGIYEQGIPLVAEFSGTESRLRHAGDMTGVYGTLGTAGWHQGGDRTVDFRL